MPRPGEIRLFAGNVPPNGWAFCHGQRIPIASAPSLYEAIGFRFGGDEQTTFALPDLRGRVPVHRSDRIALGSEGGAEAVGLEAGQIPAHHHGIPAGHRPATGNEPVAGVLVATDRNEGRALRLGDTSSSGLGSTHPNLQPYLCLNFIIALDGEHPEPFIGEVRLFSGTEAPAGWVRCDGQRLRVADFIGLYSVIGTTYGGDGRETFVLPDLRGRVAMQPGYREGLTARRLGESGGTPVTRLTDDQLPPHTHTIAATESGGESARSAPSVLTSGSNTHSGLMRVASARAGGGGEHSNMQPYLALTYLIACRGAAPKPA